MHSYIFILINQKIARYLQRLLSILALTFIVIFANSATAVEVKALYSAELPLESQQQPDLQRATKQGLAEVLVRVAGQQKATDGATMKAALDQASRYLKQYSFFLGEAVDLQGAPISQQMINLEYDKTLVDQLIRNNRLPIWGSNRPRVLVWLTLEDESGRNIVGDDDRNPIKQALSTKAKARGVPLLYPLLDLQDETAITVTESWALFQTPLENAASRYATEGVLAGSLHINSAGNWSGRWRFLFKGKSYNFNLSESETEVRSSESGPQLPVAVVGSIADILGNHYAVTTAGVTGNFTIKVTGVNGVSDYAAVTDYLAKLASVLDLNVASVKGDQLLIDLRTEGERYQVEEALQLGDKLIPIVVDNQPFQDRIAHYQWRP